MTGPAPDDRMLWRTFVDIAAGLTGSEIETQDALKAVAIAAAETVPPCVACETVYASVLHGSFGIDEGSIRGLSGATQPVADTLFAIGRASILGLRLDYARYLDFCLKETCIALHDVDIVRAADGALALAGVARAAEGLMTPTSTRFLQQALAHIALLLDL